MTHMDSLVLVEQITIRYSDFSSALVSVSVRSLVPEDACDLLVLDLSLKTAGHVEMLKLLLNM